MILTIKKQQEKAQPFFKRPIKKKWLHDEQVWIWKATNLLQRVKPYTDIQRQHYLSQQMTKPIKFCVDHKTKNSFTAIH